MSEITSRQLALNAQRWGRLSCREKEALVVLLFVVEKDCVSRAGLLIITAKSKGIGIMITPMIIVNVPTTQAAQVECLWIKNKCAPSV